MWGVVDSGADNTSLPLGFASLMGYDAKSLERREGVGAGGSIDTWIATSPSRAAVPGWEELGFEILPTFIDGGQMPLWGRQDLFMAFHVSFSEPNQEFTLTAVAQPS